MEPGEQFGGSLIGVLIGLGVGPFAQRGLAHRAGNAINAVLAAAGYNFHLLINMAGALAVQLLGCPETTTHPSIGLKIENFTGD
jgi:NhaP-type Na+/H+ or K+/H+ antiporter